MILMTGDWQRRWRKYDQEYNEHVVFPSSRQLYSSFSRNIFVHSPVVSTVPSLHVILYYCRAAKSRNDGD